MASGALGNLKIIEYAEMVSGPMCGKLFADAGAEVIKIEPPGTGDEARHHPPFPDDIPHPEKSGLFLYLNTTKKSITLNPSNPTGAEIFKALVAQADILVENHRPGFMAEIGLGWEDLRKINPRLIMASVTPFGQSGPYRDWKGTDLTTWAMSLTGYNTPTAVDDPERENPLRAPGRQAEMMAATTAAATAMMAIFHREATGLGQWLDIPMLQSVVNTAKSEMVSWTYKRLPFSRQRSKSAMNLEPSRAKDGYFYVLYSADAHWAALKDMLGNPPALESELFSEMNSRRENDDAIKAIVSQEFIKYDVDHLVREGQKRGLTIGPLYSVAQAANDPHLQEREAFVEIDHPVAGKFKYPRWLVRMVTNPMSSARAPMLGEHNEEILCGQLGYSAEQLAAMRAAEII